jgi:hypothetical protein
VARHLSPRPEKSLLNRSKNTETGEGRGGTDSPRRERGIRRRMEEVVVGRGSSRAASNGLPFAIGYSLLRNSLAENRLGRSLALPQQRWSPTFPGKCLNTPQSSRARYPATSAYHFTFLIFSGCRGIILRRRQNSVAIRKSDTSLSFCRNGRNGHRF